MNATRSPVIVPSLVEQCLHILSQHISKVQHLDGVDEHLTIRLLHKIYQQSKLTYQTAQLFLNCPHDDVRETIQQMDLLAGICEANRCQHCRPL